MATHQYEQKQGSTAEVTGQPQAVMPLQELQPFKAVENATDVQDTPPTTVVQIAASVPDLPPIDKRGFLTLLLQHVSR